jgi:hypothetical protein
VSGMFALCQLRTWGLPCVVRQWTYVHAKTKSTTVAAAKKVT